MASDPSPKLIGVSGNDVVEYLIDDSSMTGLSSHHPLNLNIDGVVLGSEAVLGDQFYFNARVNGVNFYFDYDIGMHKLAHNPVASSATNIVADASDGKLIGVYGDQIEEINQADGSFLGPIGPSISGVQGAVASTEAVGNGSFVFNGFTSTGTSYYNVSLPQGNVSGPLAANESNILFDANAISERFVGLHGNQIFTLNPASGQEVGSHTLNMQYNSWRLGAEAAEGGYLYVTVSTDSGEKLYAISEDGGMTTAVAGIVPDNFIAVPEDVECFLSGTSILTTRGYVFVEHLQAGDHVLTASGKVRLILWVGCRHLDRSSGGLHWNQHPIRVRRGAFGLDSSGHETPVRDLFLSPGHPILVGADANNEGGVLVPIMCLINGTTITREVRDDVTYWHVELDKHDILLAEGLPAESYLDRGDSTFFEKACSKAVYCSYSKRPEVLGRCRPVAFDGPEVDAERSRLDALFVAELSSHCAWTKATDDLPLLVA